MSFGGLIPDCSLFAVAICTPIERLVLDMTERRSFAQQAALFSLLVPIVAVGISVFTRKSAEDSPMVGHIIAIVNAVLILGGLMASVFALASIPKQGRSGILWQALVGLGFNSLAVGAIVWLVVLAARGGIPNSGDVDYKKQLADNKWVADENGISTTLELRTDGSFRLVLSGKSVADFSGKWSVQNRRLYLNVETILEGKADRIGNRIQWTIDKLEQNELVLGAANGTDRYQRKPLNE